MSSACSHKTECVNSFECLSMRTQISRAYQAFYTRADSLEKTTRGVLRWREPSEV